jgi:hypothetical protein
MLEEQGTHAVADAAGGHYGSDLLGDFVQARTTWFEFQDLVVHRLGVYSGDGGIAIRLFGLLTIS